MAETNYNHSAEFFPLKLLARVSWYEVRRILAPGGVLRITTPDLHKYVEGYVGEDGFFAKHRREHSFNSAIGQHLERNPVAPQVSLQQKRIIRVVFHQEYVHAAMS